MELLLIRHGQTVNNKEGKHQGWQPVSLSELGILQAEKVYGNLKNQHFNRIIASDLLRAKQTAEIIFRNRLEQIEYTKELREINTDAICGKTYDEMMEKYGEIYARGKRCFDYHFCGGESGAEFYDRVRQFMESLEQFAPTQRVVVVTHGGVLYMMLKYILGIEVEHTVERFSTDNCGMSWINYSDAGWKIVSWNCMY